MRVGPVCGFNPVYEERPLYGENEREWGWGERESTERNRTYLRHRAYVRQCIVSGGRTFAANGREFDGNPLCQWIGYAIMDTRALRSKTDMATLTG